MLGCHGAQSKCPTSVTAPAGTTGDSSTGRLDRSFFINTFRTLRDYAAGEEEVIGFKGLREEVGYRVVPVTKTEGLREV